MRPRRAASSSSDPDGERWKVGESRASAEKWRSELASLVAGEPACGSTTELSRRTFMQLMGLSVGVGLAGGACFEAPVERILPYSKRPLDVIPGRSRTYSTAMELGGHATGLRVESREGRPIKIEGNPEHPASLGATQPFHQAALLDLYDPWRASEILRRGSPTRWRAFQRACSPAVLDASREPGSRAFRILIEPTASPMMLELLERVVERHPRVRVHFHAPLETPSARSTLRALYGEPLDLRLHLERAAVILAVDSDFLAHGPFALRYARDFAQARRVRSREARTLRLYAVESAPTVSSNLADRRLAASPRTQEALLWALLERISARLDHVPEVLRARVRAPELTDPVRRWLAPVCDDLWAQRGAGLVVVGDHQPPRVHALACALNELLGNIGSSVSFVPALIPPIDSEHSLSRLVEEMHADEVGTLAILGSNPVYSAPVDLEFERALRRVPNSICLSRQRHETARACEWSIPQRHFLESWSDARALDGTASIVQPLIRPLLPGSSAIELLSWWAETGAASAYALLREHWQADGRPLARPTSPAPGAAGRPDDAWDEALRAGVVPGTALAERRPDVRWPAWGELIGEPIETSREPAADLRVTLQYRADASVYDGSFAGNPWLQEMPDPITKLTWDNAAWVAPDLARRLELEDGDWIELEHAQRRVRVPVLAVPGHASSSVTLALGYGRSVGSPVAVGAGFDVYRLRTSEALWSSEDARIRPVTALGEAIARYPLARTQAHFELGERARDIAPVLRDDALASHLDETGEQESAFPIEYLGAHQWGMSIDLNLCTGCSACVVACQAENNVPVVGKVQVAKGREMHWLRVDRYLVQEPLGAESPDPASGHADASVVDRSDAESSRHGSVHAVSQPMMCQHCEAAPCEYVCPVNATVHSPDGLNEMVYNRCIGTRFCSNNCPYKVRRFNWFDFNQDVPALRRLQLNPEVTVRARGVMEKCTYCVQRIRSVERSAERDGRPLADGDVVTACQQACPTRAIHFGDVADATSRVSRELRATQAYAVLSHLGTRPRTRYLARLVPRRRAERVEPETEGR